MFTSDASLLSVAVLHDLLVHPEGSALLNVSPLTSGEKKAGTKAESASSSAHRRKYERFE